MLTNTTRYRDYLLVIRPPASPGGRWQVLAWPPNKDPPIIQPTNTSEVAAIKDAQNAVDRALDKPTA